MFRAHEVRRIAANMMLTKMPNKKTPRMYRSGSALIWFRRANIEVLRYKSNGPERFDLDHVGALRVPNCVAE